MHTPITTTHTPASSHTTTPLTRVTRVRRHLLDHHFVTINNAGAFIDQLFRDSLLFEGNKTEIFRFVVHLLVNRSNHLSNSTVFFEMVSNVVLVAPRFWHFTNIDLALLDISFFRSDGLTLNFVFVIFPLLKNFVDLLKFQ